MSRGTVNKVILIGRVGRDPDVRYTPSGTTVASFSLATNHRARDDKGEWTDQTEWHNISVFGNQADFVSNYVRKGRLLFIEGRLQTRSWEDQNNQKHYRTEIIANSIQLLGSKPEEEVSEEKADEATSEQELPPEEATGEEDDLPF